MKHKKENPKNCSKSSLLFISTLSLALLFCLPALASEGLPPGFDFPGSQGPVPTLSAGSEPAHRDPALDETGPERIYEDFLMAGPLALSEETVTEADPGQEASSEPSNDEEGVRPEPSAEVTQAEILQGSVLAPSHEPMHLTLRSELRVQQNLVSGQSDTSLNSLIQWSSYLRAGNRSKSPSSTGITSTLATLGIRGFQSSTPGYTPVTQRLARWSQFSPWRSFGSSFRERFLKEKEKKAGHSLL